MDIGESMAKRKMIEEFKKLEIVAEAFSEVKGNVAKDKDLGMRIDETTEFHYNIKTNYEEAKGKFVGEDGMQYAFEIRRYND